MNLAPPVALKILPIYCAHLLTVTFLLMNSNETVTNISSKLGYTKHTLPYPRYSPAPRTKAMDDKLIKVLLIEDDPEYTYLMRQMLAVVRGTPFDLENTDRLSTGLERLAAGTIDIVLLDLSLPDSWGLATFARAHAQSPQVPIIVLSGLADEALAVKAVREGAQDYLVKGQIESNLLVRAMRYAIERKRTEEKSKQYHDRLEKMAKERIAELEKTNEQLQREITRRKRGEEALRRQLEELAILHTVATTAAEAIDENALIEHVV